MHNESVCVGKERVGVVNLCQCKYHGLLVRVAEDEIFPTHT